MTREGEIMADLIALRRRKGLTQEQVARRMSISRGGLAVFESRVFRGKRGANLATILRYADAIGASLRVVGE